MMTKFEIWKALVKLQRVAYYFRCFFMTNVKLYSLKYGESNYRV